MGRPKGSPNKVSGRTLEKAEQIAADMGIDPLWVLLAFAKGDWQALGYTENIISPDTRVGAAKEACKYLYVQRSMMELSGAEDSGIEIVIKDYTKKA